jgi:adenosylcobinamide-GDP ribazoletransferase
MGHDTDETEGAGRDMHPAVWCGDARRALGLLTRLPGARHDGAAPLHARAVRAYPLVGLAVGALAALAYALAVWIGLPPLAGALLATGASLLATGALHEDGLADVADGFGGGRDRTAKLAILKDSRIGAYGVLALILSVGLQAAFLADLARPGAVAAALLAAHPLSRGLMPALMWALPPARPDGLAGGLGKIAGRAALQAAILGGGLAVLFGGWAGLLGLALAMLAAGGLGAVARAQVGGYTGDVLGAAQQLALLACLLAFASLS